MGKKKKTLAFVVKKRSKRRKWEGIAAESRYAEAVASEAEASVPDRLVKGLPKPAVERIRKRVGQIAYEAAIDGVEKEIHLHVHVWDLRAIAEPEWLADFIDRMFADHNIDGTVRRAHRRLMENKHASVLLSPKRVLDVDDPESIEPTAVPSPPPSPENGRPRKRQSNGRVRDSRGITGRDGG